MRRVLALVLVLILAWHGAAPGQTPEAPVEQPPVEAPGAAALGEGLSVPVVAVLAVIGVAVLSTLAPTTSCDDGGSCSPEPPITATATGTR